MRPLWFWCLPSDKIWGLTYTSQWCHMSPTSWSMACTQLSEPLDQQAVKTACWMFVGRWADGPFQATSWVKQVRACCDVSHMPKWRDADVRKIQKYLLTANGTSHCTFHMIHHDTQNLTAHLEKIFSPLLKNSAMNQTLYTSIDRIDFHIHQVKIAAMCHGLWAPLVSPTRLPGSLPRRQNGRRKASWKLRRSEVSSMAVWPLMQLPSQVIFEKNRTEFRLDLNFTGSYIYTYPHIYSHIYIYL